MRFLLLLILVSLELLEVTRTLQRGSVEWQGKAQVAGSVLIPRQLGFTTVCKSVDTRTQTRSHPHSGQGDSDASWALQSQSVAPVPAGPLPWGSGPRPRRWGLRTPTFAPLPAPRLSRWSRHSQSREQRTHPLLPPPLEKATRLTHRIRQGHVAGPLLSQGLMHGECCLVAPANEAATSTPRLRAPSRASYSAAAAPRLSQS